MISSHYIRGVQLVELKKYTDAISSFKHALNEHADDVNSIYFLALCHFYIDDYKASENYLQSLLKFDPLFPDAHYLFSILSLEKNEKQTALKNINEAIRLNPYSAHYFGQKALILIQQKNFEDGLNFADQGLSIDPKDVICLNARTKALTKLKRDNDAYETIQLTLTDNPEDDFTHANAGWTNLERGNHKTANEHFKEALKIDPNNDYARNGMVESIKSKNLIYRLFLKYAFWIQNQTSRNQWIFIIGIYVIYRLLHGLIKDTSIYYFAPFLVFLYLVFALGSWLITPISNGILLFNNYGKYLLDRKDKQSGIAIIVFSTLALIFIALFYTIGGTYFLRFSLTSLFVILPLTHAIQLKDKTSYSIGLSYSLLMLLIGSFGILLASNDTVILIVLLMMVIYTWFSGLLKN